MPNPIKYTAGTETQALKKGNFYIGTRDVAKGPTSATGYYAGITPPTNGYTIYLNKASSGPSIYVATGATDLITITNRIAGANYTTSGECLNYFATQTDKMVINRDYESIITSGLTFNIDAGFTPSYPTTGTTWYNLGSNGYNGTLINGPIFSGGSIVFDGTDDYVTTTNFYLSTSPASILVWFKAGTQTSSAGSVLRPIMQQGLFDGTFPSTTQGIEINMIRSGSVDVGKLRFSWGGDTDPNYQYLTNSRYDDNQWHFACNINRGNTFDVYVDGVYLSTKTTHSSVSTSTPVNFGGDSSNSVRRWVGDISIAEIYDRALSTSEILQNYQSTFTRFLGENIVGNGLALYLDAGYYPSYSGTGTNWADISGNRNNGTLTNGPTFSGGSIVFDGSNDYIDLGNVEIVPSSANTITLESWVNITSFQSYRGIISRSRAADPYGGYQLNLNNDGSVNKFDFALNINGVWRTWVNSGGSFGRSLSANTWYHVVGLYDGTGLSMYLNGTLVSKQNITGAFQYASGISNTSIGRNVGGDTYMNGRINNVKIYNRNLSPFEVYQNYNAQKSRFGIPDIVTNGLVLNLDAGNPYSYNPLNTGSTRWVDVANSTTGGTLVNGTYYSGGTMVFDGVDNYVSTNTNPIITQGGSTQFTAEFWVKKTNSTSDGLIGAWNNSDRKGWFLQWYSDGVIYFGITDGAYNYNYVNQSYQNQWFHIVGVFNGGESTNQTKAKIYVNGVLKTTNNNNNILTSVPSNIVELTIGKLTNYSSFANGNISKVSIYNRALNDSEVLQNYNALKERYGL